MDTKKGRTKHCKYGMCNSDSRYLARETHPVEFFKMPKPCKDYYLLKKDPTLKINHSEMFCAVCQSAKMWIIACGIQGFNDLSQIDNSCYVCSKHFNDGKPTENHPYPIFKNKQIKARRTILKPGSSSQHSKQNLSIDNISSVDQSAVDNTSQNASKDTASADTPINLTFLNECEKKSLKRKLEEKDEKIRDLRRKVKCLQNSIYRRDKKIMNLRELLSKLRELNMIDCDLEQLISTKFSGMKLDLINNEISNSKYGKNYRQYSEDIINFSMTLHFLSPKAYEFARKHLTLPNKSTLRKKKSTNGAPGWISESFKALKSDSKKSECCLIIDGIHLKTNVEMMRVSGGKEIVGYIDYGAGPMIESGEKATEAVVVMAVGLIQQWRIPLAYFLSNGGLKAEQQKELIEEGIKLLADSGIKTRSIVCDGASTNIATLELLGANIPFQPYFYSNILNCKVYTLLDPAHMIKLARNAFARDLLIDTDNSPISWKFIENLFDLQKREGLKLANKITAAHVTEWDKRKMKVSLATQVLSNSIGTALQFLRDLGVKDFEDSQATVKFVLLMDKLFDRLNARSPSAHGSKKCLTRKNVNEIKSFFDEVEKYLLGLRIKPNGELLHSSRLKTFVIGFIASMKAVIFLVEDLFDQYSDENLWFFAPYRLSQDSLEHFFGDIRMRGGWSQNPTPQHFRHAFRSLVTNRLRLYGYISSGRNCLDLKEMDDEGCLSDLNIERNEEENNFYLDILKSEKNSLFRNNVLFYIGGYIARIVSKTTNCSSCKESLFSNNPTETIFSRFTILRQKGGLLYPSRCVFKVVCITDKYFKLFSLSENLISSYRQNIAIVQIYKTCLKLNVFDSLNHDTLIDSHREHLIKSISSKYLTTILGHSCKTTNEDCKGAASNKRNQIIRNLIFKGL